MEAKWPFILITFGLFALLGYMIARLERTAVMNDWEKRRCDLPIMTAAFFFKPEDDMRTKADFASDNFSFCMKSYVDRFINFFAEPINSVLQKQINTSVDAANGLNMVRKLVSTMFGAFTKLLDSFFKKFTGSVFEMKRMMEYFKMAFNRLNGIVTSMIYTGLSVFRGIVNFILFIIKVVMIICGIMLIIIIILFFILFPVMPIILATLAAIVTGVLVFSGLLSSQIANEAEGQRKGFCFSEDTVIMMKDGSYKKVQDVKIGDELGEDCGRVTAVVQMDGTHVTLYDLDGTYVSESHLVQGKDKKWRSVSDDKRAKLSDKKSPIVYCFNTTSNNIPIRGETSTILYRDWEELGNDDVRGQFLWNYLILSELNRYKDYDAWKKDVMSECEVALMGKNTKVKTSKGWKRISEISFRGGTVLNRHGKEQGVRGVIYGEVENAEYGSTDAWHTALYEERDGVWMKGNSTVIEGAGNIIGMSLITDDGEFIIWDEVTKKEVIVRDFTEIGYQSIHETYPFIAARLSGY
jgi:hypothetical protein